MRSPAVSATYSAPGAAAGDLIRVGGYIRRGAPSLSPLQPLLPRMGTRAQVGLCWAYEDTGIAAVLSITDIDEQAAPGARRRNIQLLLPGDAFSLCSPHRRAFNGET